MFKPRDVAVGPSVVSSGRRVARPLLFFPILVLVLSVLSAAVDPVVVDRKSMPLVRGVCVSDHRVERLYARAVVAYGGRAQREQCQHALAGHCFQYEQRVMAVGGRIQVPPAAGGGRVSGHAA